MNTKIKICGVTQPDEVLLLDEFGVSYAGLWYGIPDGRYNLDLKTLLNLSSIHTRELKFILVTIQHDIPLLSKAIENSHIYGIQFHGFQLPAFIKKIKLTFGDSIKIFKVLHVRNNKCAEEYLIERYIEAGTDVFILDSYQDKHQIGSTGIRISDEFIKKFFSLWGSKNKIMLAGGIDENIIETICLTHHPYGVDIDSAARCDTAITRQRVSNIMVAKETAMNNLK